MLTTLNEKNRNVDTGLNVEIPRKIIALVCASMLALQSIVSLASPCEMSVSEHSTMSAMATMPTAVASATEASTMPNSDHHAHHTEAASTDAPTSNCCDGGYCSQNGCMSPSALSDVAFGATADSTAPYKIVAVTAAPHWSPSSLYRPPST